MRASGDPTSSFLQWMNGRIRRFIHLFSMQNFVSPVVIHPHIHCGGRTWYGMFFVSFRLIVPTRTPIFHLLSHWLLGIVKSD